MKKRNEKGFFLVETMFVISVVAVVLLIVFKLFTSVYYGFLESENYNTVNAINALSNIQKYYESIGEIDTSLLSETNTYVELTNDEKYASPYYTRIKEEYGITDVYLIDLDYFLSSNNVSTFPVLFRRYLKTLKNIEGIVLVICTKGNEFSYVKLKDSVHITLNGDEEDEYGVYINVGGTFTDPGYTGWDGEEPQTEWENGKVLDTNVPGTYYLHYNFDGYLFRRKVEVGNYNASFSYTGSEQEYVVNAPGYYKLEVWGAQGASDSTTYVGGYGGYSFGTVNLNRMNKIFVYVGGKGVTINSTSQSGTVYGYPNGGAVHSSGTDSNNINFASGGGSSHILLESKVIKELEFSSILIVAGGGGGANTFWGKNSNGGNGGGYIGTITTTNFYDNNPGPGSQTSGGTGGGNLDGHSATAWLNGVFGEGGGYMTTQSSVSGGGGGGFYGGGASWGGGGSGGSGYIGNSLLTDKYMYCYNCATSDAVDTKTYTTTCVSETPTANCAKIGNGYAKITYLGQNYTSE